MPLITISRGMGSGGTRIARLVADGLELEHFDDQRLQREAVEMGIRSEELESLNEKAPGFFDHLWGYKPELYLDLMESVVYEVARGGEGVILGHGSQLLLRDFGCALHGFIRASESSRIQYMMAERGLSDSVARKLIQKSDHERRGFLQFAFHMNWDDPSLYDLVINTEKLGTQGAAELIMEAARSSEIKECSLNALESMGRMALTKKVQAALLRNNFSLTTLHVEVAEKGVVHINGLTESKQSQAQILKIVKEVPGVSDVQSEVAVLPAGAV